LTNRPTVDFGSAAKLNAENPIRICKFTALQADRFPDRLPQPTSRQLFRGDLVCLTRRSSIAAAQTFKGLGAGLGENHPHVAIRAVRPSACDRLNLGFPAHHFVPVWRNIFLVGGQGNERNHQRLHKYLRNF
jgi:hypothetical protein